MVLEVHDWRHGGLLLHDLGLFSGAALFGHVSQSSVVAARRARYIKPLFQLDLLLLRIARNSLLVKVGDLVFIKSRSDTRDSFGFVESVDGLALDRQVLLTRLLGLRKLSKVSKLVLRVLSLQIFELPTHFLKSGHI